MRKLKILSLALVVLSLQGCIALEVGHLAGILLSPRTTIAAESDIMEVADQRVYGGRFFERTNLFNRAKRCTYDVTLVTYSRDWVKIDAATGASWAAEPDKIIGVALLVYKEYCPGQQAKDILMVGDRSTRKLFGHEYLFREGHSAEVSDYFGMQPDDRPKWMPQVMKLIEGSQSKNPAAKAFLDATVETRSKL